MPANAIEAPFIEHIHDVLVGIFLPFNEKVEASEFRDKSLIESAAARPFQTFGGTDVWPTIPQKAAALFHSLACNHCFLNGNKRTAVIALDMFMTVNEHILTMTSDEVYAMAIATTEANRDGRTLDAVLLDLASRIDQASISFENLGRSEVSERLGLEQYARFINHVQRVIAFTQRLIEIHQPQLHGSPSGTSEDQA